MSQIPQTPSNIIWNYTDTIDALASLPGAGTANNYISTTGGATPTVQYQQVAASQVSSLGIENIPAGNVQQFQDQVVLNRLADQTYGLTSGGTTYTLSVPNNAWTTVAPPPWSLPGNPGLQTQFTSTGQSYYGAPGVGTTLAGGVIAENTLQSPTHETWIYGKVCFTGNATGVRGIRILQDTIDTTTSVLTGSPVKIAETINPADPTAANQTIYVTIPVCFLTDATLPLANCWYLQVYQNSGGALSIQPVDATSDVNTYLRAIYLGNGPH